MPAKPMPPVISQSRVGAAGALHDDNEQFKILLVDGNRHFVSSASKFLMALDGVSVVDHAGTGAQALTRALALQPDLVLLDIAMPVMNGLEVAAQMQTWARVPAIVFLSQSDNAAYREAAHLTGATACVIKSNLVKDLTPLVAHLVALRTKKAVAP